MLIQKLPPGQSRQAGICDVERREAGCSDSTTKDASQGVLDDVLGSISLANRMQEAAADVFVPEILQRARS